MGLLALLEAGPSHGYELKPSFEARTGGVRTVKVSQVYSTLERLEADGLGAASIRRRSDRDLLPRGPDRLGTLVSETSEFGRGESEPR